MEKCANWKASRPADAIPQELKSDYLKLVKNKGQFWYEQQVLCMEYGLRNIEARELRASDIDLGAGTITLTDSKQTRSFISKHANKIISDEWITEAQIFLYEKAIEKGDQMRAMAADLLSDESALENLSKKLRCHADYLNEKNDYYLENITRARTTASKLPNSPKGRLIQIGNSKAVLEILKRRIDKYSEICDYLFPACELNSNRARSQGYKPVTRQTAYRIVREVREELEKVSSNKRLLSDICLSLHSLRKSVVQEIVDKRGLMAASRFIGHGNGQGDLKTTQNYLDKSSKTDKEVAEQMTGNNDHIYRIAL